MGNKNAKQKQKRNKNGNNSTNHKSNSNSNHNDNSEKKTDINQSVNEKGNKASKVNVLEHVVSSYPDSIIVLTNFWTNNVLNLSTEKYYKLALLFYEKVFQAIPNSQEMFKKAKTDMQRQAKLFFGMFGWFVSLVNKQNHKKSMKQLRQLGKNHLRTGVKPEHFPLMLEAFHATMQQEYDIKYTLRVRFCFARLYDLVTDIMLGRDFVSLIKKIDDNEVQSKLQLESIEACLDDEYTFSYLELFMKQRFCAELILFVKDYRVYKQCSSDERNRLGKQLQQLYVDSQSERQLNLSWKTSITFHKQLLQNKHVYTPDIFDECYSEVYTLIADSVWYRFRDEIMSLLTEDSDSISLSHVSISLADDFTYQSQ